MSISTDSKRIYYNGRKPLSINGYIPRFLAQDWFAAGDNLEILAKINSERFCAVSAITKIVKNCTTLLL
ncbi:MAG: hypothetical protein O9295_05845 [Microcystis sp. LE18-22.4A]|uniref:hypothetical protein n=1 Tax=Microcystis sp. LE18-22.4A TaxID=3016432 RepID=UPI0022C777EA|nr:hypothetical protein [Microcystis sp. LE18-22.4A]MCZ8117587.1 hypothetical protein [Microcystis sp. LE18-22.4A]